MKLSFARIGILFALCAMLVKCSTVSETRSSKWQAISTLLMERIDLQPGERVLIMGAPGEFDSLIVVLSQDIIAAGGELLGAISTAGSAPREWHTAYTRAKPRDVSDMTEYFANVDLGIMMPGALPSHPPYAAMQAVLQSGHGRTIHFHWAGAYDLNNKEIDITDSISDFYYNALIETDYKALADLQQEFEADAQNKRITVTDANGTNISFEITGRPVTRQDGDASKARTATAKNLIDREVELPAGAIRVAPLEESVEGTIAFPDALWNGESVKGLLMTFKGGKVVDVKATEGVDAVNAELAAGGESARSFREFVIGLNPALVPANKTWIPYYGYGAGVVRLSLGNNQELGGNVTGSNYVRWNFFPNTTVTVGEHVWVKDGELVANQ